MGVKVVGYIFLGGSPPIQLAEASFPGATATFSKKAPALEGFAYFHFAAPRLNKTEWIVTVDFRMRCMFFFLSSQAFLSRIGSGRQIRDATLDSCSLEVHLMWTGQLPPRVQLHDENYTRCRAIVLDPQTLLHAGAQAIGRKPRHS